MLILLVEDDPLSRMMIEDELVSRGHRVVSTGDPMEAIQRGVELKPHLVISDWQLGEVIDGVGVCNAIKSVHPKVSLILITGASAGELQEASEDLNPFNVLPKPFDVAVLAEKVQRLIN